MANGNGNPLTAPLSMLKQVGEQTSAAIQSVGSGLTRAASQSLDALVGGLPGLPGAGAGAGRVAGIPTPQQLMPANLQQALGQIENILIPAGLPKPSQAFKKTTTPPAAETAAPANGGAAATTTTSEPSGAQPTRRRVMERRGL